MGERGRPRSFDRANALQRAMELFWAKSFEGVSLSDLTTTMGINPPSLYAAFSSKEALFREAVELYRSTEGSRIWSCLDIAATARDAVFGMLRKSAEDFSRTDKPRGCLVVLGALHSDLSNTAVNRDLADLRVQSVMQLQERLQRGVEEGELSQAVDVQAIATFYVTVQQGMSIQARDGASREMLLATADCAMVAWDGLVAGQA
ncbi:MAG: TetR/AcrR family transcriptional regulator [Sneathiella sp.]|nr:TetR/AcrR family transcriptional regulator [Sneathiella sp.]